MSTSLLQPNHKLSGNDIKKTKFIVKGKFGKIYKGRCRGSDVAIKVPINQKLTKQSFSAIQNELQIMSELHHPNLCLFMGACLETNNIQYVTELMEGDITSLLLSKTDNTPLSVRMDWALQASKGICWMHSKTPTIIHMDIKSDNILFDSEGRIKVCDFGLSVKSNQNGHRCVRPVGSPLFMSPEMLRATVKTPAIITEKTDVYSFGIALWEILTKKKAYSHHSMHGSFKHFQQAILVGERPPIPTYCTPTLKTLLQQCWAADPTQRPSFPEIVETMHVVVSEYKLMELKSEIAKEINDPCGAEFWYDSFQFREIVLWSEFCDALCLQLNVNEYFNEDSVELRCLKELIVGRDNLEVSRDAFGSLLRLFGPLEIPYSNNGAHLLDRIIRVMELRYFCGCVDKVTAEHILREEPSGSFIVRICEDWNAFCVSYRGEELVNHVIVRYRDGLFHCCGSEFISLAEAVRSLHTGMPCITDKYSHIFARYNVKTHLCESFEERIKTQEDSMAMDFLLTK